MRISTAAAGCSAVLWTKKMYFSCEDTIRAVAEAGFDAIDMSFVSYGREGLPLSLPDWRDWIARRKEDCDAAGLVINQGHAHYYGILKSREFSASDWEENTAKIYRDIEAAGICKVPWLVFHPDSCWDSAGYSRRLTLEKETERFSRFADVASKWGVGIAIENVPDNRSGERYFGGTAEDLLDLVECLGDDKQFGICWDTGHANLNRLNQPECIRQMGKYLKALHVNDNRGEKDDHTLPYLGKIEWEPILLALREIGYAGDFTYEIHKFTSGFDPALHQDAMKFAYHVARQMVSVIEG